LKEFFLDRLSTFITQYKDYTEEEIEKLNYGLEGLYLTITKSIIILFVSFLLGNLKETLIVLVFFNILRFTGFGFHARKSNQCLILSIILFSVLPFLFLTLTISPLVQGIILAVIFIIFLLYAPADTEKRPLPNKKKRIIRKICTLATATIYTILILITKNQSFANILLVSLMIEAIMVHPFTYRLFRQPYRNYKNYSAV